MSIVIKTMYEVLASIRSMSMVMAAMFVLLAYSTTAKAQAGSISVDTASLAVDTSVAAVGSDETGAIADTDAFADMPVTYDESGEGSFHKALKDKFIEGNAGFMSLVALTLVIGLALCIERIVYLTLSDVNDSRLLEGIDRRLTDRDVEGAKQLCRDTRGPVASICYQGLCRIDSAMDEIERSVASYGTSLIAGLEKGCSWITLFIAIAPSLGFLGTVIGMVMAFDRIQIVGDISPTIVAAGMKVALITTIFGIIVAVILQIFYSFILSKIENLTAKMEEDAVSLFDMITRYKQGK